MSNGSCHLVRIPSLINGEFYYQSSFLVEPQLTEIHNQLTCLIPFNYHDTLENSENSEKLENFDGSSNERKRQAILFSTNPDKPYIYNDQWRPSLQFEGMFEQLRRQVSALVSHLEGYSFTNFDTCYANYYPDGSATIALHCDKEEALVPDAPIASVSFGAVRHFDLQLKNLDDDRGGPNFKPDYQLLDYEYEAYDPFGHWICPRIQWRYRMDLQSGSLLVMGKRSQRNYLHSIPSQSSIKEPRLNLTFRVTR